MLSDAELVVLLKAIEASKLSPGIKAAFRTLALSGQRSGEIAELKIADLHHLDGEAYAHIPAVSLDADGDDGHIVKRLQVDPHAFRRTCITGMAKLRVPKEYRKAIVAHVDGDVEDEHYDSHDYFAESSSV